MLTKVDDAYLCVGLFYSTRVSHALILISHFVLLAYVIKSGTHSKLRPILGNIDQLIMLKCVQINNDMIVFTLLSNS